MERLQTTEIYRTLDSEVSQAVRSFRDLSSRQRYGLDSAFQSCLSTTYSIWLFTFSDLKSVLIPFTIFALTNAHADKALGQSSATSPSTLFASFRVLFWVWTLLVPYTINNQNQPEAIAEDGLNKPWRPLPSGRLSPKQAKQLMFFFYGLSLASGLWLGGFKQAVAAGALAVWYNSYGGSDESVFYRHLINGLQCATFASGSLQVALGHPLRANMQTLGWFGLLALVIFTTLHVVDMPDQEGDAARSRQTLPLVVGDESARLLLALAMICWSIVCPRLWSCSPVARVGFLLVGLRVAVKTLTRTSVKGDKQTYRLWCAWMVLLYVMPLFSVS